jgi:hypothetical protein
MINMTIAKAMTKTTPRRTHTSPGMLPPPPTSGVLVGEGWDTGEGVSLGMALLNASGMGEGVSEGSIVGLTVSEARTVAVCVAVWVNVLLGAGGTGVSLAWGGFEGCAVGWPDPCVAVSLGVTLTS